MTEQNNMTFEEAYTALQETVNALDNPRKSLDESLVLYERACRLSLYCHEELEKAKAKITELDTVMHKNGTKGQDDLIEE